MRKVIQIASAGTVENGQTQSECALIALCDDGTLWTTDNRRWADAPGGLWTRILSIPQDAPDPLHPMDRGTAV